MAFPYEEPRSYIQPRDLYDHGPNSMIEMELNLLRRSIMKRTRFSQQTTSLKFKKATDTKNASTKR